MICSVLSRDVRYTIGQGLTKLLMNILVTIYEANIAREKHPLLIPNIRILAGNKSSYSSSCFIYNKGI